MFRRRKEKPKFDGPKPSLKKLAPRILQFARPQALLLTGGFIALILASGINLLFPWLIKELLNGNTGLSLKDNLQTVAIVLVGLFFVQALFFYVRHLMFHKAGYRVVADIRRKLYASMVGQDISFFDREKVGDLLSRLSSDTQVLQRAVTVNLSVAARYLFQVVGGVILMMLISPALSLSILAVVPLMIVAGAVWGKKLRLISKNMLEKTGEASTAAEESLGSIKTVRAFTGESRETDRYSEAVNQALDFGIARSRFGALFSSTMVFIMHSTIAVILCFGIQKVLSGDMSEGDLIAFVLYSGIVSVSFVFLLGVWDDFMSALGAGDRIFAVLDEIPLVSSPQNALEIPKVHSSGLVEFEDVSFQYPSRPELSVLQGLSLRIEEGETVALVGPSGAGKSTIAALIPRFYDPAEGIISFKGVELKQLSTCSLREDIAVVEQNPQVFSVSVRENILYGKPDATDAELIQAIKSANLEEFIDRLPEGLDTLVGNRGIRLSGGEKQRLAIARALIKNASLLILDEATSSLDSVNEQLVQQALETLMKGKTCLIIAHRLSTVQHADKVLVLRNGQIVEEGTHSSLLAEDGLYKNLVNHQLL